MMKYPVHELVDRYAIARLRYQKTGMEEALKEYTLYLEGMRGGCLLEEHALAILELDHIHRQIWALESDIRQGREGLLGLEEVGRRALAIRDLNAQRVEIKNRIASAYGLPQEIKSDHASARRG